MVERTPSPEISDAELVEALRSRGINDLEVIGLLFSWTMQEEAKVGRAPRDGVEFNIRRGKIYVAAGYHEEALEMFQDALLQAEQEVIPDLCEYLALVIKTMNERR